MRVLHAAPFVVIGMDIVAFQIVEALLDFEPKRRRLSEAEDEARDVIYQDRVQKDGILICPHCNHEIGEKATFSDDNLKTTRHRGCNGIIKFRPPDDETLANIERAWGIKLDKETNTWGPVSGLSGNDDMGDDDYDEYA